MALNKSRYMLASIVALAAISASGVGPRSVGLVAHARSARWIFG